MKTYNAAVVIACIGLLFSGCVANGVRIPDSYSLPDLVVPTLETKGTPTVNLEEEHIEVPIRVVVENQGDKAADFFQVAAFYTDTGGEHVGHFAVPGQVNTFYPSTSELLAAGGNVTFVGKLILPPLAGGSTVSIKVKADTCIGAEFVDPEYCRVEESNEDNNESAAILVSLPVYLP